LLALTIQGRVGSGPFPSELNDEWGEKLQTIGKEFGVTTGRRRRCGWLDLNVVKYSAGVNSYTAINLTKLDILDTFPEIKIVVSYRHPMTKKTIEGFPADLNLLKQVEVEYEVFQGWLEPIGHCRSFSELPRAVSNLGVVVFFHADRFIQCRDYVDYIEKSVGVTIKYIGVGKSTSATRPVIGLSLMSNNRAKERGDDHEIVT
jgi:adenylosuccinate synthase